MSNITKYHSTVLLPVIVRDFRMFYGRTNPITAEKYCETLREKGFRISSAEFRKIVKHIQTHGLIKYIVADHYGFYRTSSKASVRAQISSLQKRIVEMQSVIKSMKSQIGD